MKSGAPAFGTPEYVRATQISGQMARYYNLPLRTSNANAANAPDAKQFGVFIFTSGLSAGLVKYGLSCGWLAGGWPDSQF